LGCIARDATEAESARAAQRDERKLRSEKDAPARSLGAASHRRLRALVGSSGAHLHVWRRLVRPAFRLRVERTRHPPCDGAPSKRESISFWEICRRPERSQCPTEDLTFAGPRTWIDIQHASHPATHKSLSSNRCVSFGSGASARWGLVPEPTFFRSCGSSSSASPW
jgi:hypothetical protein